MNWIWIILLLCCCKGNNDENCIQPRRETRCGRTDYGEERCASRRDYPRPPFAPDCERDRDRDRDKDRNRERDCDCRASEMDKEDCEE